MLRNYFLVTIRNLIKNYVYSIINVSGLAIGITCSILILLWVQDELAFDKFHPKSDRLYQVWVNAEFDGNINSWRSVPLPTHMAMKDADTKIKNTAVTDWGNEHLLRVNDIRIIKRGYFASDEFLEMFEFPLIQGDASVVLDDASSIVITESLAKTLFPDEDPMDKIIRVDNENDVKVVGILKDVPENSTFQFDYLLPWNYYYQHSDWVKRNTTNWGNYSFQVYVELDKPENEISVEQNIADLLTRNGQDDIERKFFLHPLIRWRLHSNFENGVETGGMSDYVQLFTIIAIFIVVIACINFMNLATARSERRAREVGIRKSVGSTRWELILQFIGESVFIALIAFIIAIGLSQLLLPSYNTLVEKQLFIDYTNYNYWLFGIGFVLIIGLFSGSYPAFYLSHFSPVKVLKGKVHIGKGASTPRKVLVTLQFSFSILLIIGTIVIYQQIQLSKGRDLGYDQENLISVTYNDELAENYNVIKQELLNSGEALAVNRSNSAITQINSNNFLGWPGKPEDLRVIFTTISTDYDYCKTMGIKILEGRDFSEDFKSDTLAIIINKAGLEIMGLENPIGTEFDLWGHKRTLIGIIDNVIMGSPSQPVKPMFAIMDPTWIGVVTIRLRKTNDLNASLQKVQSVFEKYNSAYPFEYKFADEEFARKFTTINLTSTLASLFAFLTILITGLGLFGLASYTAEQKTKEISIRKVLGASVASLINLMSRDFSKLVIVAFIISSPISWWLMNNYLERYPIRTEIYWWIFPVTGLIALVFALTIIIAQSLKAAHANPVNSLRNE
ncbi:MAG TPA: ABC transporter permease [Cyclobacteriaceae bacterium]